MYAHQTYVPAPVQQSAPILSVDRMNMTAHNLEQTVPLLHEAHTAKDRLVGAYQTVQHQVTSKQAEIKKGRLFMEPKQGLNAGRYMLSAQILLLQMSSMHLVIRSS